MLKGIIIFVLQPTRYFKSIIRGYHAYKDIWTPDIGEVLSTMCEPENKHDSYAVAVQLEDDTVVGYISREIAKPCSIFIKQGGHIECKITGGPQQQKFTRTKDKERLEVPCIYKLSCGDEKNLIDTIEMLQVITAPLVEWVDDWYIIDQS